MGYLTVSTSELETFAVQSGEAISLDCQCRGDLALRHRTCAVKWSRVKGDVVCDICKTQARHLANML